jgi:Calx-beta domain
MPQFPRFRFLPLNRRKTAQSGLFYHLRNVLALSLAALIFLAPLALTTSAQQATPDSKAPNGDYFIIYQDENGDTVCRAATLRERREQNRINNANLGLHPITPAKREYDFKSHGDNAQTGENDLPAHLTIILRATTQLENFPEAKAAFIRAAQIWEAQVLSPITIYIDADFGPKNGTEDWEPQVLGSTSSPAITNANYQFVRSKLIEGASNSTEASIYNSLPSTTVPTDLGDASVVSVSSSIARAIGLLNATAQPTDLAAHIGFNSNFQYDFDPSNGIDSGKTDFEAVATHEIGHALGFTSRSGAGGATPSVWDLFRFRTGTTASTFTSAQRIMTKGPTTGRDQFYFVPGNPELGLSTGGSNPPQGQTDGDGNQSSHWKQRSQNDGVYIGIMDPRIPSGTRRQIMANDTNALNIFGYNLDNSNPPPPPPPSPAPPANDNFANAQVIVGCTGSLNSTNISATKESGEPDHDPLGVPSNASVWYQWQAPVSSSVTITTAGAGTDFDTMLGVYTGNSFNSFTVIKKNDDVANGNTTSSVTFDANAGTIYKIAVDGWRGEAGSFNLNWAQSNCAQSATVALSSSGYTIGEASGSAQVVVTRTETTTAATVNYATSDTSGLNACNSVTGLASSRCDYATSIGTLRFAIGESSKTIYIPIIDDNISDGTETFTLTLSNPSGASLGSTTSAVVTITDNANTSGNPIDGADFFIREHYIDFLGREPEPSGLAGWLNVYNNCGRTIAQPCDRIEISSAFFRSSEFQDRASFIYRFYSAVGKIPLYEGFMPDFAKVSGFLSAQELEANKVAFVNEFMTRSDYQSMYGSIGSNDAYVTALLNTLGLPTHANKQAWINTLNGGASRAAVLRAVTEDGQVSQKYYNEAFVIMQYFGYLRRSADLSYLQWIQTMNSNGGDYREMINGFLNSAEYRNRFQ